MRVLALDTTTLDGSLAIVDGDRLVIDRAGHPARSHAERLPGDLIDALNEASLTLGAIDLFAVVSGPGSFTGLRIGIAAIQGLALVQRKRVVAVSALDALGQAAAAGQPAGTLVAAWMDAQRHEVFAARYRVDGEQPAAVSSAVVGAPSAILAQWAQAGTLPAVVAGDGAARYADLLRQTRAAVLPHPRLAAIAARIAQRRGAAGETLDPAGVQPVYIRRPDAEIARDAASGVPLPR